MHIQLIIFIMWFCESATLEIAPHVEIPLGEIEGTLDRSVTGRTFYSFEGIPYAEPPIGKNRFKEPIPRKTWEGCYKANMLYECVQYNKFFFPNEASFSGTEDCLYVNVYTASLDGKLDVLVYIHGGAFLFGSGGTAQPHILMDRDVVVVTLNYRLGPLGFLSTEDDILPGNNGLKDQILALKWIKENIQYFGGNPDSITISGTSAGGASVHFHMLSPKSEGLFHKAISSSGSMLNPWALMENPLDRAKEVAVLVGCKTENMKKMVECLRERPANQITQTISSFQPWESVPFSPFAPVVDRWSSSPVLPEHPFKLLKEKKVNDVPWILAQMAVEGHCNGFEYYSEKNLKYLDEHWNELMPHILHYNFTVKRSDLTTVGEKIRKEYLGNERPTLENLEKLLTLIGDRLFNADFDKVARLHAAAITSPVYFYSFNYRGAHSITEILTKTRKDLGASHGDDFFYVMKTSSAPITTPKDSAMSKLLIDMYLTFAKHGQPNISNVKWMQVSKNEKDPIRYLRVDSPSSVSDETVSEFGNRRFWDSLSFDENENIIGVGN